MILPQELQIKTESNQHLDFSLVISGAGDPAKPTLTSDQRKLCNGKWCGSKPLSLWLLVMQQEKTNIVRVRAGNNVGPYIERGFNYLVKQTKKQTNKNKMAKMPNNGVQINLWIPRTGSHYHLWFWEYNRRRQSCQRQSWKDGRIRPVGAGTTKEMKTFWETLKEGGVTLQFPLLLPFYCPFTLLIG